MGMLISERSKRWSDSSSTSHRSGSLTTQAMPWRSLFLPPGTDRGARIDLPTLTQDLEGVVVWCDPQIPFYEKCFGIGPCISVGVDRYLLFLILHTRFSGTAISAPSRTSKRSVCIL